MCCYLILKYIDKVLLMVNVFGSSYGTIAI